MSKQKIETDYGVCPNGCQRVTITHNKVIHAIIDRKYSPNPMRKRGSRVFCNMCGYSVNRADMIVAQRRGIKQ